MLRSFVLALFAASPCSGASLGDRLVLEIEYFEEYTTLPLTVQDAVSQGWEVSQQCQEGLGLRATGGAHSGSMHLWFDTHGAVMGYGVRISCKNPLFCKTTGFWRKVDKQLQLDFLFRSPEQACSDVPSAVPGSIGDRLLMVTDGGEPVVFPSTQPDAVAAGYKDAGPCWTDMGYHMLHSVNTIGPVIPLYTGDGTHLQAMNTPSILSRSTPPFEYFPIGHGGPVHGLHVYFSEHKGTCGNYPTLAPFDAVAV